MKISPFTSKKNTAPASFFPYSKKIDEARELEKKMGSNGKAFTRMSYKPIIIQLFGQKFGAAAAEELSVIYDEIFRYGYRQAAHEHK